MELKQIKELMGAMGRSGIKKVIWKEKDSELHLEREENGSFADSLDPEARRLAIAPLPSADMPVVHHSPGLPTSKKEEPNGKYVTSPMVGTFYSAPTPDDPVFVKVGDQITEGQVVCIVEAMKVMNEVKAGVSGVVSEILIQNGHPVEFGTKIFRIS